MCFPGSHDFASLDKKPAGRRWRRGSVNQWSLLLPRIGKDKQGFVAVRGGVFGTPHPPLRTQPALSLQLPFRRTQWLTGFVDGLLLPTSFLPHPKVFAQQPGAVLAHGHSGFVVLFFLALLQLFDHPRE